MKDTCCSKVNNARNNRKPSIFLVEGFCGNGGGQSFDGKII